MSDLELKELVIETADCLKLEERKGLQIKLVTDHECQPTMNE